MSAARNSRHPAARALILALVLIFAPSLGGCALVQIPLNILGALTRGVVKGGTGLVNLLGGALGKIGGGLSSLVAVVETTAPPELLAGSADGAGPIDRDRDLLAGGLTEADCLAMLRAPLPTLNEALANVERAGSTAPAELLLIPLADLRDEAGRTRWSKQLNGRTIVALTFATTAGG